MAAGVHSAWGKIYEAPKFPGRDGESDKTAGKGQDYALGEQLASEPRAARSEGETRFHLLLALGGAREHEVGDVGAGNDRSRRNHFRPAFPSHQQGGPDVGDGFTPKVIWSIVKDGAVSSGLNGFAPHDLRGTCARRCHQAGGELEQIQFLLGHFSIETTERYLGCKERFKLL